MVSTINNAVRSDIGGDEQRIDDTDTTYENNAIKIPVAAALGKRLYYSNKLYQFTINTSTGEANGR